MSINSKKAISKLNSIDVFTTIMENAKRFIEKDLNRQLIKEKTIY